MGDSALRADDYCYRHPDRPSFVLCDRCARTICLECQTHVDGKVLCPDDAHQVRMAPVTPIRSKQRRRIRRPALNLPEGSPIASYAIMAVLVVVFFADLFAGGAILNAFAFTSGSTLVRPWAFLTAMLLSPGILSLLFNGFSVWVFGRQLEQQFGRSRYLLLYVLGGLGATVFVALFGGIVASASGAIFGLMGAFVVFARRLGGNMIFIYAIIGINLVLVILLPGAVSWQGALGGLVVGAVTALTYYFEGSAAKARQRRLMLTGISAVLVVLALVKALVA